jgi:hypothetical protein
MAKRVYFAFHYEDVSNFRANVVRNHNFTGGVEKAGYFDASMWEEAKKKNPDDLKALIEKELNNTSVTAVLIGTGTYARRWVQYEIISSMYRGNSLIGIHINGIKGKDQIAKAFGANPFEYLSVAYSKEGTIATPMVWDGRSWVKYSDFPPYSLKTPKPSMDGQQQQLSKWVPIYDWQAGDGFNNFSKWIGAV